MMQLKKLDGLAALPQNYACLINVDALLPTKTNVFAKLEQSSEHSMDPIHLLRLNKPGLHLINVHSYKTATNHPINLSHGPPDLTLRCPQLYTNPN